MRPGSSSGVPAAGKEAAAAPEVPTQLEMVLVPLTRAAALMLVAASKLRDLIADTETSCAKVTSVIDLLDGAPANIPGLFLGPLPRPIFAATRTVARLCGDLPPPAAYMRIDRCRVLLERLVDVFAGANADITRCADILLFAEESPQWRRWRRLMGLGADHSTVAGQKLFEANGRAGAAYMVLHGLVKHWDRLLSLDQMVEIASAECSLGVSRKFMEDALAAMRQMLDVVDRQANVMIIILGKNQAPASSASSSAARPDRSIQTLDRGRETRFDCKCM
jgi:hypothetical protein